MMTEKRLRIIEEKTSLFCRIGNYDIYNIKANRTADTYIIYHDGSCQRLRYGLLFASGRVQMPKEFAQLLDLAHRFKKEPPIPF